MIMKNKLWCDCTTDEQKIEFVQSGRAVETGIIATVLVPELIALLKYRKRKIIKLFTARELVKFY